MVSALWLYEAVQAMATKTTIRAELELSDGSSDFSLWTIRMMAHFRVLGLKAVVISDKFDFEVSFLGSS